MYFLVIMSGPSSPVPPSSPSSSEAYSSKSLKSTFRIAPRPTAQLIHFAPATEKESGFRAVILRDTLTPKGHLKLIEPFAADKNIVLNCLGEQCWMTEPIVFIQTCQPGTVMEDWSNTQPRFVMSTTGYLNWLKYMNNDRVKVYNTLMEKMKRIKASETMGLGQSIHMFGEGDLYTSQELDVKTDCIIEVNYNWMYGDAGPKMTFDMKGISSHMQYSMDVPVEAFSYLKEGVKRLREELKNYKKKVSTKRLRQSANGMLS